MSGKSLKFIFQIFNSLKQKKCVHFILSHLKMQNEVLQLSHFDLQWWTCYISLPKLNVISYHYYYNFLSLLVLGNSPSHLYIRNELYVEILNFWIDCNIYMAIQYFFLMRKLCFIFACWWYILMWSRFFRNIQFFRWFFVLFLELFVLNFEVNFDQKFLVKKLSF